MREQHRSDWVEVELGEVANLVYGKGLPTKNLTEGGYPVFGANGIIGNYSSYLYEEEQVLISCRGAASGTINISPPFCFVTNNSLVVEYSFHDLLLNQYLYYILRGADKAQIITGSAQPQVTINNARNLKFPLPPLPEQRVIVAKLEQLFSELDQGIASLQTARKQLDTYRQAVLKQAFEGELTREWRALQHTSTSSVQRAKGPSLPSAEALLDQIQAARAAHHAQQMAAWEQQIADWEAKGKEGKKPRKPGRVKKVSNESAEEQKIKYLIQDIPDTWVWVKVANVGEVQLGRQRSPKHHSGTHMRPYLRVANVFENRIDLSDVLEMNFTPDEFETYELKDGDILLNEGQSLELVGRPAMYRGELPGACFQNTLVRFRPYSTLDRKFALHLMLTYFKLGEFQKIASWTTSIAHLGAGRFAELFVPIPSLPEQHQIVAEIESRLSVCDKLVESIEAGLQQAEALRQSLLKQAFEGRLLSEAELAACRQEPDWEPAGELLARIKAEKKTSKA